MVYRYRRSFGLALLLCRNRFHGLSIVSAAAVSNHIAVLLPLLFASQGKTISHRQGQLSLKNTRTIYPTRIININLEWCVSK